MAGFRRGTSTTTPTGRAVSSSWEPIAVGQRTFEDGCRAVTRVFTCRMPDAHLAARASTTPGTAWSGAVRPTAGEVAGILSKAGSAGAHQPAAGRVGGPPDDRRGL